MSAIIPASPQAAPLDSDPQGAAVGHRLDALLGRIRALHRARQAAARELSEAQGRGEGLRQHLEQLEERLAALEGLWQQKQEALRVARLRREEVEAEGQRRRGLCRGHQQHLEGAEEQRRHLRHLQRQHRQEFWRQLDDITEQHRRLQEAHAPSQLAAELERLEEAQEKLLSQERRMMEAEELLGPAAHVAAHLVQEEAAAAGRHLEAELGRGRGCRARRDRLAEELQRAGDSPRD